MNLEESAEHAAFRQDIRTWLEANLPPDASNTGRRDYKGLDDAVFSHEWNRILGKKGWLAYNWPAEAGGTGWNVAQQVIFEDECRRVGAPIPYGFGIAMLGPTLIRFGTDAQKQRFLPPITRHEEIWCQGYSEPNAGSDLASLQTRAELTPDGKHFIVNGQKIWTSGAQHADWIFCLVRTDGTVQKQKGISFLLIDMKSPGISIKPIRQIDDQSGFNETFFDNVQVPAENLVGELNQGWTVAKALLENERAGSGTVNLEGLLRRARSLATEYQYGGQPLLADADYRERMVQAEMDWDCYCYTRYRIDSKLMRGESLGPEASLMKLYVSELSQRVHDLGLEAMASDAAQWYGEATMPEAGFDLPMAMCIDRAFTIYSGSSEVQRNIIAKRVLNLPD